MKSQTKLSIAEAVAKVLSDVQGPIPTKEFVDQVLTIRPSSAKNPGASIREHLRWQALGKSVAYLDRNTIVPLRVAMRGVRFRIPLSRQEVKRGILLTERALQGFVTWQEWESIQWLDEQGKPLLAPPAEIVQKRATLGKTHTYSLSGVNLRGWMKAHRARADDCILVTIESWEPKCLRIELESHKERRRHHDEIARQNQELANVLYDLLENSRNESIHVFQSIPTAYARLADPRGYPGSHWTEVVDQDPRVKLWSGSITYPDRLSPLESLDYQMRGVEPGTAVPTRSFSHNEGQQVYRFKASLKHRSGLWRRIEIRGEQTLGELDSMLRDAFDHDSWDHMSGFWLLVRRGKGKRFREVDLGDVNPLGEGSAADVVIAGVGLQPGSRIKYVYDFGDWIEHEIKLEAIEPPDLKADYPRTTAQNKPRYRYCEICKEKGEKTVATWICIECSDRQQREVLICEACLDAEHPEHYIEEILY